MIAEYPEVMAESWSNESKLSHARTGNACLLLDTFTLKSNTINIL